MTITVGTRTKKEKEKGNKEPWWPWQTSSWNVPTRPMWYSDEGKCLKNIPVMISFVIRYWITSPKRMTCCNKSYRKPSSKSSSTLWTLMLSPYRYRIRVMEVVVFSTMTTTPWWQYRSVPMEKSHRQSIQRFRHHQLQHNQRRRRRGRRRKAMYRKP